MINLDCEGQWSKVKVTAGRRGGKGIHIDAGASKSFFRFLPLTLNFDLISWPTNLPLLVQSESPRRISRSNFICVESYHMNTHTHTADRAHYSDHYGVVGRNCLWSVISLKYAVSDFLLPSNRQHQSCDDCLEVTRENNQNCSVLYCDNNFIVYFVLSMMLVYRVNLCSL